MYIETLIGSMRSRVITGTSPNSAEALLTPDKYGIKEGSGISLRSAKKFTGFNVHFQNNLKVSLMRYAINNTLMYTRRNKSY